MSIAEGEAGARVKFELTEVRSRRFLDIRFRNEQLNRGCLYLLHRECYNLADHLPQRKTIRLFSVKASRSCSVFFEVCCIHISFALIRFSRAKKFESRRQGFALQEREESDK